MKKISVLFILCLVLSSCAHRSEFADVPKPPPPPPKPLTLEEVQRKCAEVEGGRVVTDFNTPLCHVKGLGIVIFTD